MCDSVCVIEIRLHGARIIAGSIFWSFDLMFRSIGEAKVCGRFLLLSVVWWSLMGTMMPLLLD